MNKEQGFRQLTDDALGIVNGGAKTIVEVDDTKTASGGMKLEVEGEEVFLINDGDKGFRCTVNGKEYRFSLAEIEEMLRQQLGN